MSTKHVARYASCWRRIGAHLIDMFALTMAGAVAVFVLEVLLMPLTLVMHDLPKGIVTPVILVMMVLYFPLMMSSPHRATLGMMAVGIVVTDEQGGRLTFGRALARYLISWVTQMTFGIGYLTYLFTSKRQVLHDMLVKSVVVEE